MLSNEQIIVFYQKIGELIKDSRKLKNINQETLSTYLGISRVSLVNIENGKQRAPIHVLIEISDFLKVPLKELLPQLFPNIANDLDANIINKIHKETGSSPDSGEKAIDFVKSFILKK
ncbi:MAG: helix-turn-helix domain-containing protein [Sphingobacteriales bacterium]